MSAFGSVKINVVSLILSKLFKSSEIPIIDNLLSNVSGWYVINKFFLLNLRFNFFSISDLFNKFYLFMASTPKPPTLNTFLGFSPN